MWELATKIYSQSGHKIEFSMIRDVVNNRIVYIKNRLAAEDNEQILEQACRDAEEKRRIIEKDPDFRNKVTQVLGKLGGDEGRAKVFVRVRRIISEQLAIDETTVSLDSHLSNHLGGDYMDLNEVIMALEEEFDIEIPDIETEKDLDINYNTHNDGYFWSSGSTSLSSYVNAGEKCIVRNFVELIYKKVY